MSVWREFFLNPSIFSISTQPNYRKVVWASRSSKNRILLILWIVKLRWERKKANSNGHSSSFGRPFDAIFFLNPRIFSISTQPNYRDGVCACRFSQIRILLIFGIAEIWWKNKKGIRLKRMSFSNRSRKNTRIQKKDCVKRTFESKVTIIWKFSILMIEVAVGLENFKRP